MVKESEAVRGNDEPTPWRRRDVAAMLCNAGEVLDSELDFPAVFEFVRCGLPWQLARQVRSGPVPGFEGAPTAIFSRTQGHPAATSREYIFRWDLPSNEGRQYTYRHVNVSAAGGIQMLANARTKQKPKQSATTTAAEKQEPDSTTQAPDNITRIANWLRVAEEDESKILSDFPEQNDVNYLLGESGAAILIRRVQDWHDALFSKCSANEKSPRTLQLSEDPLILNVPNGWRRDSGELVDVLAVTDGRPNGLSLYIGDKVMNFALPKFDDLNNVTNLEVVRRPLTFYGDDVYLYEITDGRACPRRTAHLLVDHKEGWIEPIARKSDPIHAFSYKLQQAGRDNGWSEESNAAGYVDFFCRFVYDPAKRSYFPLLCDATDLDWVVSDMSTPETPVDAIFLQKHGEAVGLGLWRLRCKQAPGDSATNRNSPRAHYFSALLLHDRDLYLCAMEVSHTSEGWNILMLGDYKVVSSPLPVMAATFDVDRRFEFALRQSDGRNQSNADNSAEKFLPPPPSCAHQIGDSDGWSLRDLLLCNSGGPLPDSRNPGKPLEVRDALHLRGQQEFKHSIYGNRVVFKGRVDLREVKIAGSLDLRHCVFEDEVLLQDAEIEGSLDLQGSVFRCGANLRGIIVHGNAKFLGAFIGRPDSRHAALELSGGRIDGDLDLRALEEISGRSNWRRPGVRLRDARIGGRLLVGCDLRVGRRAPFRVGGLDGEGVEVLGDVLWRGGTGTWTPDLSLCRASVKGSVVFSPYDWDDELRWELNAKYQWWCSLRVSNQTKHAIPRFGSLDFSSLEVDGDFTLSAIEAGSIELGLARVNGSVSLESHVIWNERDKANPRKSEHGRLVVEGNLDLRGIDVKGTLTLSGAQIKGDVVLTEAKVDDMLFVGEASAMSAVDFADDEKQRGKLIPESWRCEINGNLELSALNCASYVRVSGAEIGGLVRMLNGDVGALQLYPAKQRLNGGDVVPVCVGGVYLSNCVVHSSVRMPFVRVAGRRSANCHGRRGITIHHCLIEGDVVLWQVGALRDLLVDSNACGDDGTSKPLPWNYAASVHGDLHITRCTIHGDCLLSFTKVGGALNLSDTEVLGHVMLGSRRSHEESLEGDQELLNLLRSAGDTQASPAIGGLGRAYCCKLDADRLTTHGDLVLDGLDVRGSTEAKHLTVEAKLIAWKEGAGKSSIATSIRMTESADLDFAHLNMLRWPLTQELSLRNARIETLALPPADTEPRRTQAAFHLDGTQVTTWNTIDGKGESERELDLDRVAMFLQQSPKSMWQSVETWLRRQGSELDADAIYRWYRRNVDRPRHPNPQGQPNDEARQVGWRSAFICLASIVGTWLLLLGGIAFMAQMPWGLWLLVASFLSLALARWLERRPRQKDWSSPAVLTTPPNRWGLLKHPLALVDWLYDKFLGYGTRIAPVVILLLAMALGALPVYLSGGNFEMSNASLAGKWKQEKVAARADNPPDEADAWTWGDALGFLLHTHVPIASINANDDWSPHSEFGLEVCLPNLTALPRVACLENGRGKVDWLSPQGFITWMQALHWVLWPLLLTFVAFGLWRRDRG